MIIKALMENTAHTSAFLAEHGLSLYIEANGKKILFDFGRSSAFAQNATTLGVDLSQVDFAVLSHAHHDHSGGLKTFLSQNDHAPVYVSKHVFDSYLNTEGQIVGPDQDLRENPRLILVEDELELSDGIALCSGEGRPLTEPIDSSDMTVRRGGVITPDDFRHEQYLEITQSGKRVLISGCSHKGIVNITHWFKPDVLIGGFHLMKLNPNGDGQAALDHIADSLAATDTIYYTGHCTGVEQYQYLKQQMKDQLFYLSTGQEITV